MAIQVAFMQQAHVVLMQGLMVMWVQGVASREMQNVAMQDKQEDKVGDVNAEERNLSAFYKSTVYFRNQSKELQRVFTKGSLRWTQA